MKIISAFANGATIRVFNG